MDDVSIDPATYPVVIDRNGFKVSASPWGPDDEIGRLNWMTGQSQTALLRTADFDAAVDLSLEFFVGMPSWLPGVLPKYESWMTFSPEGAANETGADVTTMTYTATSDCFQMSTHCGTHMDTLNHFGYYGSFWNGWSTREHLGARSWTKGGADKVPPLIARGILLDIPRALEAGELPDSYQITSGDCRRAASVQGIDLRKGDVVLVRTGRMTSWPDAGFLADEPGVGLDAARFLCEVGGAMCIGTDNAAFEPVPPLDFDALMPVHCYMLATAGAPIIEMLDLEALAAQRMYEFAFLGFPLRLRGATGTPLRAVAVPLSL